MKVIKVALADDHVMLREAVCLMLSSTPGIQVVAQVGNSAEAIKIVSELAIDCLLLDLSLPDRDGIETVKAIRLRNKEIPILILSMHPEEQYAIRALKAGASGYINKRASSLELIAAIKKVSAKNRFITPEVAELLADDLNVTGTESGHAGLSDREYQYMVMAASGMTVTEIAEKMALSSKTVSVYRSRALKKMNMRTTAALVNYAIKNNLVS
jgi:DNA-binding NarL/FixJ family response regulator